MPEHNVGTQEELRPFLEGEIPPAVKLNAESCGSDRPFWLRRDGEYETTG
jgi:hypothetical protein